MQWTALNNRTIFCYDNLEVLRAMPSECMDLIYLDPPFNKKKVFHGRHGSPSEGTSFKDSWDETDVKHEWTSFIAEHFPALEAYLRGIEALGPKSNKAYLMFLAVRLIEMKRLLKKTGSLYLHCDPTMSHYLKILLDGVMGYRNYRNEIIWHYKGTGRSHKKFLSKHELIYFYAKSEATTINPVSIQAAKPTGWTRKTTKLCDSVWQINTVFQSKERRTQTGYPMQKPLPLLERIIQASTHKGEMVLDPFCGCATTCVASEALGRSWIGIDISSRTFKLAIKRLSQEVQPPRDDAYWEGKVTYYSKETLMKDLFHSRE